jgi:hypothetical protein
MTMHRLPDKKAAISSLQREDGGEMKIVQEGSKAKRFRIRAGLNYAFYGPEQVPRQTQQQAAQWLVARSVSSCPNALSRPTDHT